MTEFHPAKKLEDVEPAIDLQPLELGDPRWVDLSTGRGGADELTEFRHCLRGHDARGAQPRFAKIAFTGHRGGGKSTELLRLEHDVSDQFTTIHLYAVEEALREDYEYTDLFLWLVDELVREFDRRQIPLNAGLVEKVTTWFAEVTVKQVDLLKSEVSAETEAKAGVNWFSIGLMGRLKSMLKGSTERRTEIRRQLQQHSAELLGRVNLLLDNAQKVLEDHAQPANLLIVVDNLDRLPQVVARTLFFKNGDWLKQPRAHLIYTVPIAIDLAPDNIETVFEHAYTLPMVKVRGASGGIAKKGMDALLNALSKRVDLGAVFTTRQVARKLVEMSGGSIRDLMRLVSNAQLAALAEERDRIDMDAAKRAVRKMRLAYERLLIPRSVYFPLLVQIHRTKSDGSTALSDTDPQKVQNYRSFFREFLSNGSVLEYNGDRTWYDVHPVVQDIETFQKALADAQAAAQIEKKAD